MGSSFYLQIAPYLLLEYTYGGSSTTYVSNQVKLARIKNAYLNDQVQFLTTSPSQNITQNVLDTSAANLGGNRWAFLDKDVPVPYISTDSNLTYTDLSSTLTSLSVLYDRVRIHILSGYRLDDIEGVIAQVYVREGMSGKNSVFANNVFLKSDDRDILNPKPFLMGDRMYDRYFEFLVPSLKEVNADFYVNPLNSLSLGYQYSSDNKGFLRSSAIYVKLFEISEAKKLNGNTFLYTSREYEVNINQEDSYTLLTASIEEATDGDYFKYFASYKGGFIGDFIAELNSIGGDYIVINDVDVYEQVGTENVLSYSFSQVQLSNFEEALNFRPILKYSDVAVSFSVDYTIRIFNRENGFQIIRKASATSFSPKRYGKQIEKIALTEQSYPFKVYNKIAGNAAITYQMPEGISSTFNTLYVPVFYETKNLAIQSKSILADGANPINPDFPEDSIYLGQGDARLYLSDFDSYVKFTVNQFNPAKGSISKLNLTNSTIQLAFKDLTGADILIPAQDSTQENSLADGELVFKIPAYVRTKVIGNTKDVKNFYLLSSNTGSSNTIMYTGTVDNISNIGKETARLQTLSTTATSLTSLIAKGATSSSATTTKTSTPGQLTTSTGPAPAPSIISTLTSNNAANVNTVKQTQQVQPPSIPGFTIDQKAVSVKNALTPASNSSTNTAASNVSANLTQNGGTQTTLKN